MGRTGYDPSETRKNEMHRRGIGMRYDLRKTRKNERQVREWYGQSKKQNQKDIHRRGMSMIHINKCRKEIHDTYDLFVPVDEFF